MKSWVIGGTSLIAGSLLFLLLLPESESTSEISNLVRQEQQSESRESEIAAEAERQRRVNEIAEQEERERQKKATGARLAIPELPEWEWSDTREWNLPLNNPAIVTAAEAFFLDPEDTVCGVLLGRHARAYPWYVLANYHAINDQIGGQPVIVNLCEMCNGGAAFHADAAGTTLDFRPRGIKNGTWYAVDFQTGSYWYPFIGKAFEGPLQGSKLRRIRLYFSTWRDWVRDHPKTTVVLSNDEVRNRSHGRESHMASDVTFNPSILQRLITKPNPNRDRLPGPELVFGLIPKGDLPARAYRFEQLKNTDSLIQTRFDDVPLVLFVQNQYQIGAYVRRLDDVDLELTLDSNDPLQMSDQLGNVWNAWGRTVSGPNHPAELPVADGYLAKWYEWVENFPDAELVNLTGES